MTQSIEEKPEVLELFSKAQRQGFVTPEDILEAFPTPETDLEALDNVYAKLSDLNVEVVDGHKQDGRWAANASHTLEVWTEEEPEPKVILRRGRGRTRPGA